MYCQTCGHPNPEGMNYCSQDGTELVRPEQLRLSKQESLYCASCGGLNETVAAYCVTCGTSLEGTAPQTARANHTGVRPFVSASYSAVQPSRKLRGLNTDVFQQALFSTGISIALLLILSLITSTIASSTINDFLYETLWSDRVELAFLFADLGRISLTDLIMLSHLISAQVSVTGVEWLPGGSIVLAHSLYLLLLIPFAALFVSGHLAARRNPEQTLKEKFYLSLATGSMYTLFLLVVSMFAGTSVTVDIPLLGETITAAHRYSFWSTLFHGIVLGTLLSFLGTAVPFATRRKNAP